MIEMNLTRRIAISFLLVIPLVGLPVALPGCGGEKELPVIDSKKPKDELQKDIENPYGAKVKEGKPKRK